MASLRDVMVGATFVLAGIMPVPADAQNCKPSASVKDKITKVQITEWAQGLYQTGLMAKALVTTSEINISGSIARIGDANTVNIILSKSETNTARAVLESPYKAEKGNEFFFGFKEGGDPLRFTADEVSNNVAADILGKLNTRVVLTAHISNEGLRALKDSLANKNIDAVRVSLANNLTIEKSVNDRNGKQFVEKIGCFLAFAEKGSMK